MPTRMPLDDVAWVLSLRREHIAAGFYDFVDPDDPAMTSPEEIDEERRRLVLDGGFEAGEWLRRAGDGMEKFQAWID
uniref:Uncharacterized protein n=1 Tax=Leersia perrieri TaxID=77586 RepID=A0A0D9XU21_9ORYZ